MKLLPVAHTTPKVQFRGILIDEGRDIMSNTYYSHGLECETGEERIFNNKSYYPFSDETTKEIKENIKKHSGEPKRWNRELVDCVEETIIELKKKLPFTKAQFLAYTKKNPLSNDEIVKFAKLFEFLRKKL